MIVLDVLRQSRSVDELFLTKTAFEVPLCRENV